MSISYGAISGVCSTGSRAHAAIDQRLIRCMLQVLERGFRLFLPNTGLWIVHTYRSVRTKAKANVIYRER